jgi:hypothetical protein
MSERGSSEGSSLGLAAARRVEEYVPGRDLKEQQRARPLGLDEARSTQVGRRAS